MASVWTLDDLSHMWVFIIDGASGACCDRGSEISLKIARTPTIISFNINYGSEIQSSRLWANTKMKRLLWNKCGGEVWIMEISIQREESIALCLHGSKILSANQADRIRVTTFQGRSTLLPAELWGKVSDAQYIQNVCLACLALQSMPASRREEQLRHK